MHTAGFRAQARHGRRASTSGLSGERQTLPQHPRRLPLTQCPSLHTRSETGSETRERALVFVEHRRMQYRLIELARARFGLTRIDLINGDTPITQRQAIVNRFQRKSAEEEAFNFLVLGPKAAGTGLQLELDRVAFRRAGHVPAGVVLRRGDRF
ncbi:helicase-related protein [Methylobacterium sp. Gmos1]